MTWKPELDDLARREAFAREMGGVDKVKRQRDQGRLTVRERIDGLVDENSFHEIGAISGVAEYSESGELTNLTPANCVFGRGKVGGRPVVVVGDDFTVRGGSADASISTKPLMAEEMAHDFRLPVIRIIDTAGTSLNVGAAEFLLGQILAETLHDRRSGDEHRRQKPDRDHDIGLVLRRPERHRETVDVRAP